MDKGKQIINTDDLLNFNVYTEYNVKIIYHVGILSQHLHLRHVNLVIKSKLKYIKKQINLSCKLPIKKFPLLYKKFYNRTVLRILYHPRTLPNHLIC